MLNRFQLHSRPTRRDVIALVSGLAVALLVVGLAHLRSGRTPSASPPTVEGTTATPSSISPTNRAPAAVGSSTNTLAPAKAALPELPRTDDPASYARSVVEALFSVDPTEVTRVQFLRFWRGELPNVVYSDAATKGLTLAAQNNDVIDNLTTSWIPTQNVWDSAATDHTTNRFTITSISVPDYWVNAVADGTFRDPGLHMERVMGVLTEIYGIDPAHRYTSARAVVIDLGLLCGPTQAGGCRLVAPQQPPDPGES